MAIREVLSGRMTLRLYRNCSARDQQRFPVITVNVPKISTTWRHRPTSGRVRHRCESTGGLPCGRPDIGRYIIKEVTLGAGPLTQSPVNIKLSRSFDNITDPWGRIPTVHKKRSTLLSSKAASKGVSVSTVHEAHCWASKHRPVGQIAALGKAELGRRLSIEESKTPAAGGSAGAVATPGRRTR